MNIIYGSLMSTLNTHIDAIVVQNYYIIQNWIDKWFSMNMICRSNCVNDV